MNKSELVRAVAKAEGLTIERANQVVSAITEIIGEELAAGQKVVLAGFGTWSVKRAKARTGANPQTGAKMEIPARNHVRFKAGTRLADRLAG